jgi:uncharacterized protein (TIGR00251 family)
MSVRGTSVETSLRLRVRVIPGARRSEVVGRLGEAWKVRVAAPPERGRANDELIDLLARTLRVPRSSVRVTRGHTTGQKLVEVEHLTREAAERRLVSAGKEKV